MRRPVIPMQDLGLFQIPDVWRFVICNQITKTSIVVHVDDLLDNREIRRAQESTQVKRMNSLFQNVVSHCDYLTPSDRPRKMKGCNHANNKAPDAR